jgi:hypothetical protein
VQEVKVNLGGGDYLSLEPFSGQKGNEDATRLAVGNGLEEVSVLVDSDEAKMIISILAQMI